MKGSHKHILGVVAFSLLLAMTLCGAAWASGTVELQVSSGTSSTSASGSSVVFFSSKSFNGWDIVLEVGASNSPGIVPSGLDLISALISCPSGACLNDPLNVAISDTGFTQLISGTGLVTTLMSTETGSGTVTQTGWYDTGDGYFGTGSLIGTIGPTGSGSFSASSAGPGTTPYSLTLHDTFNANGSPATFVVPLGDISATPEPATMLLMGTGLLVVGGAIRRRRHA